MITKEEIKAILATKEIVISKDDPVLSFLAVHQVLLDEYSKTIGSSIESSNQKLSKSLKLIEDEFSEKLKAIQIEVNKNMVSQMEFFSERSKKLANDVVGKAVNEFNLAEHRVAEQISKLTLTDKSYPYDKKFKNLELWLICNTFLLAASLFIGFIGIFIK